MTCCHRSRSITTPIMTISRVMFFVSLLVCLTTALPGPVQTLSLAPGEVNSQTPRRKASDLQTQTERKCPIGSQCQESVTSLVKSWDSSQSGDVPFPHALLAAIDKAHNSVTRRRQFKRAVEEKALKPESADGKRIKKNKKKKNKKKNKKNKRRKTKISQNCVGGGHEEGVEGMRKMIQRVRTTLKQMMRLKRKMKRRGKSTNLLVALRTLKKNLRMEHSCDMPKGHKKRLRIFLKQYKMKMRKVRRRKKMKKGQGKRGNNKCGGKRNCSTTVRSETTTTEKSGFPGIESETSSPFLGNSTLWEDEQAVNRDELVQNAEADTGDFDVIRTTTLFRRSLSTGPSGDKVVLLDGYIKAYKSLVGMFDFFGKIFYFAKRELVDKLAILKDLHRTSLNAPAPSNYATFKTMFAHEYKTGAAIKGAQLTSGVRENAWIHRALKFVISVVRSAADKTDSSPLSLRVESAYKSTMAPYHSWMVRMGVTAAIEATFPTRKSLWSSMKVADSDEGMLELTELADSMQAVYDLVQGHYDDYESNLTPSPATN